MTTVRTHVVTGAGSGIGHLLAQRLAERGDQLVLMARNDGRAEELRAAFPGAQVLVADLAEPGTLHGLGRQVDGPVDSLVQVAGVVHLGAVAELRLTDWQVQMDVNLTSPALLTREFLPALRQARGTAVFVNSTAALAPSARWAGYAASKAGLRAFADSLRHEEAEHGVRVSTVLPSRTATPMQESVHAQEGRDYDAEQWIAPESVVRTVLTVLDLARDATIPEVVVRPGPRP